MEHRKEKADYTKGKHLCRQKRIILGAHKLRKQNNFDNIRRKCETEDTKSI